MYLFKLIICAFACWCLGHCVWVPVFRSLCLGHCVQVTVFLKSRGAPWSYFCPPKVHFADSCDLISKSNEQEYHEAGVTCLHTMNSKLVRLGNAATVWGKWYSWFPLLQIEPRKDLQVCCKGNSIFWDSSWICFAVESVASYHLLFVRLFVKVWKFGTKSASSMSGQVLTGKLACVSMPAVLVREIYLNLAFDDFNVGDVGWIFPKGVGTCPMFVVVLCI